VKWLLDTNVISESTRARPNANVIGWISSQPGADLAMSSVTLAELINGASNAGSEAARERLRRWIDTDVAAFFKDVMIDVTVDVLIDWIRVSKSLRMVGKVRDTADMLIASTARVHSLTVVTRNIRDFADTGIVVYDPWNDQTHRMDPP
jgi:toxin FitB